MEDRKSQKKRQEAIVELVRTARIQDQKQMVAELASRYGIETNQAVVSRDLRRLGVVKMGDCYELSEKDVRAEILKLGIIDIVHNESMIVIKTVAGLAAFVGDFIDSISDADLLGSLAGENMVFVAPCSVKNIKQTYALLCKKLYFKG